MKEIQKVLVVLAIVMTIATGGIVKYKFSTRLYRDERQKISTNLWSELPAPKENTFEDAINSITQAKLKKEVDYLAADALEGRMSGKKGNVQAAQYVKQKYESFGLSTMMDRFSISRVNPGPHDEKGDDFTQNVYAWIEGNDPVLKNEVVVIGAHFDHIGYGPTYSMSPNRRNEINHGADDNASGTAAVLEIAEAFALLKDKVKRTIVFQSYSAEEMGLLGSAYYCRNPKFPLRHPSLTKHVAMINLDMIGYLGKGRYLTADTFAESSLDLARLANDLSSKYSFAKNIIGHGGGSDHASFNNKGVPNIFLFTGLHPYYHTPDDTVDRLNYSGMEKITQFAFELAWKVSEICVAPCFNYTEFQEMPTTHDHGVPEVPFRKD